MENICDICKNNFDRHLDQNPLIRIWFSCTNETISKKRFMKVNVKIATKFVSYHFLSRQKTMLPFLISNKVINRVEMH